MGSFASIRYNIKIFTLGALSAALVVFPLHDVLSHKYILKDHVLGSPAAQLGCRQVHTVAMGAV